MPGTRVVKPTRPWPPGTRPVPSEVRLVDVVDGTPAVPMVEPASKEERYGAASAWRSSRLAPRPSIRNTTYDAAPGRSSPRGGVSSSG